MSRCSVGIVSVCAFLGVISFKNSFAEGENTDVSEVESTERYQRYLQYLETSRKFSEITTFLTTDFGYNNQFADFNADGIPDLYRLIGINKDNRVHVTVSGKSNIEHRLSNGDGGYLEGRSFHDFSGDGRADYISFIGYSNDDAILTVLEANSSGTGFNKRKLYPKIDAGYPLVRRWFDINGDGNLDFIRTVGISDFDKLKISYGASKGGFSGHEIFPFPK